MKKWDLLYTFLISLPILDLLSSITNRITDSFFSVGMIIKGLAIIISVFYIIFRSSSKHRKITLWYFGFILLYILLYFSFKTDLLNSNIFLNECNYLLRFIYFPTMLFTFINIFDEKGFPKDKLNKIIFVSLIIYIIFITIPTIFNINFSSYSNLNYAGSVGWYYAANEVSTILLLLFPFIYVLYNNKKIVMIILFLISLYTIGLIGTKVTLFGILIITFLILVLSIIKEKKINSKNIIIPFLMFLVSILFMVNNYAATNMKNSLSESEMNEIANINKELSSDEEKYKNDKFYIKFKEIGSKLLSSRDVYALNTYRIYKESYKDDYSLFGMGFSNTTRINNIRSEKLIEIDILDVFFHLGIVGILLLACPFIYALYIVLKEKKNLTVESIFLILMILLTLGISSTAGHVFLAPAVSIYIAIYFCYLFNELKYFDKTINQKKISILALHLGYGGVENVIANTANMLKDDYEVEIISLYKKEEIPFKIDRKVKIKYLTNTCSNKELFKNEIKNKNIVGIFKEGFKAIYILINKNRWIKKGIIECDSKIIISTRIEFSKILNKYSREEIINIHQEHTYSVSTAYIKGLNNLENIDYIMPVSMPIYNEYKDHVNAKLKYIPLSLNYYPETNELSKLNTNNLIAIGRLEKEKGFYDLLTIVSKLKTNDIYLNIFGDGSEKEHLIEYSKELGIQNKVKFWGFKDQKFISKYLKESSLYMMTSFEESFGLVIIEAMSYKVPCISFDSAKGAISVINKDNGFIVKNRNIDEYSATVDKYLNMSLKDKELLGKNARITSSEYKFENIKKEWLKFIGGVIK